MKNCIRLIGLFIVGFVLLVGCASQKPMPVAYLSLEVPKGVITTKESNNFKKEFSRGGFYFFNYNFRPAPDLRSYIEETAKEANSNILRNADIQLNIPFAFDILFFGINGSTDVVFVGTPTS